MRLEKHELGKSFAFADIKGTLDSKEHWAGKVRMVGKSFAFAAKKGTLVSKEHWASTEQMLRHAKCACLTDAYRCLMTPFWRAVLRNDRLKIHERLTFSELGIFASFTRKMLTNLKICFSISGDDHPTRRSEVLSSVYLCRV